MYIPIRAHSMPNGMEWVLGYLHKREYLVVTSTAQVFGDTPSRE